MSWSADPDHSPRTLQAAEARLRRHLLPTLGQRQLRAITVSVVRQWQNDLRGKVGYDTVMACRSLLYRILQAAEDDRRIEANPVRKVPAPKPPVDPAALLGRAERRAYTPEEFGYLLASTWITSMVCRRMWPSWCGPAGNWAAARNWIACGCGLGRTCSGSVVMVDQEPPLLDHLHGPAPRPATAFPWSSGGDPRTTRP